jgi:hypothetical protein
MTLFASEKKNRVGGTFGFNIFSQINIASKNKCKMGLMKYADYSAKYYFFTIAEKHSNNIFLF